MTTVRIVFAHHHLRPARAPDGSDVPGWRLHHQLIVLADTVPTKNGGHRAVPLWLGSRPQGAAEPLAGPP